MNRKAHGFTIVELLIVIVVIAILAAISIAAYVNIQERARFSAMRGELASINKAIQLYYAENGYYPITPSGGAGQPCSGSWCGYDQATGDDFVPGLVPAYVANLPQLPQSNARSDTYLYRSPDGKDYKLIRYNQTGLSDAEKAAMKDLMTTDCNSTTNDTRWGYWSSNTSRCW
ncbi:prepilin-type N-terminal cleavage/methylation domain-containing protein [Candidatus Saccharibacteria bacterium]|nr:prepilin-type N-terminal cleavage/methylation domain-containing protein [Candidatus Saccharibacteria bacterium]